VHDLDGFRAAVRERRRTAGRTQRQLARAIGLHPDVLSHKLHQRGAVLTPAEVVAIVATLAGWKVIGSTAEARTLALMAVPEYAIPAQAWAAGALGDLPSLPAPSLPAPSQPEAPASVPGPRLSPERDGGRLSPVPVPVPMTELVGRRAEVATVVAAVAESRLVTLTGAGGIGKTRVAAQAAAELAGRFPGGVAYADLAPVGDPGLVGVTLLRALGVTPAAAATAEDQLGAVLRPRRVLLVIDNMEHLVEEGPLLARLLTGAPELHLLVTSRISLGLYGEHQVRVPPLGLPGTVASAADSEAVQLFLQQAEAASSEFKPGEDALAAAAAVCAAVDGLPLAIELAAAWVRLYPPQALPPLLQARLSLLTGGPRDRPRRHQTLRATLEWSDSLLSRAAHELFVQLGVFAGPFDTAAAVAVCGTTQPAAEVTERLAELAEHSLLEVTPGSVPRFAMLATVREYALARLAETGWADQAHTRHLRHYLDLATQARGQLAGAAQREWLDRLEAEFANIRAALDWGRARAEPDGSSRQDGSSLEDGLRLATAVGLVWRRRGSMAEGALYLEHLLVLDTSLGVATPATRAWALLEASALACLRGDYSAATGYGRQGQEICAELGDLPGLAWAHRYIGEAALAVGDLAIAESCFNHQLALARRAHVSADEASARNMLAQVFRYQGRYRDASAHLHRALGIYQAMADQDGTATILNSLGEVARDSGQLRQARSLLCQALDEHRRAGSKRGMAADFEGLATAAALTGSGRDALTYLGAAQTLREESGSVLLPAEQAILDRILESSLAAFTQREREQALTEGRNGLLDQVIARALSE
jgi:predicted ATPase